ncbi:hypothetical protein SAMN05216339_10313 [Nitrosomonas eutropha]|uniref:STAS domain-containing protein n=1 Tax=Nitrosomonas eutropha TaxID=916 RepID=A0A1I7GJQ1_9PROT|nr:hypothetical protein [Nitrosomonas eutropha]SFU48722.1 hypothetical protein SAMN05216339_10313 [Nitrosomonas eutropha]
MSANNLLLDFTSPGAIPPDPVEEIRRIVNETQIKMQVLESLLENEQVEDVAGWQLLAMFYLATDQVNDLAKIERLYKNITGVSLSANLKQKYTQWFNKEAASNPIIFEIPKKITAETLPVGMIIQRSRSSPGDILLDFSNVQEIDNNGLRKLARLFSSMTQESIKLELKQIDHFIDCLQNKAEASTGTRAIWDVLFAYERLQDNRKAFEEKAIQFAILYGISPPSWE